MNELALKDIHLPDPIGWWPPSIGWWILLILLVLLAYFLPKFLKWLRYKPVKTLSLIELQQIQQNHQQQGDHKQTLADIAALLRRTVMSQKGRGRNAGLIGDEWVAQLNQISASTIFSVEQGQLLTHGRYQPLVEHDIDDLLQTCERWIKSLPKTDDYAAN